MKTIAPAATDERGAIMVVALFFAVLVVGVLYTMRGISGQVRDRERTHDAADALAFSAASVYARSMNAIGLINQGQMVVSGTLQTIELVVLNAHACSNWGPQACRDLRARFQGAWSAAEAELAPLLTYSTRSALRIRDSTPGFATQVVQTLAGRYRGRPRISAVHAERPMPLRVSNVQATCTKTALFLSPLLFALAPGIPYKYMPAEAINRDETQNYCTTFQNVGPLVLKDPLNTSGTERHQVRVIAIGDTRAARRDARRVEYPNRVWGEPDAPEVSNARKALSGLGVAQGEYFATWRGANEILSDTTTQIPEEATFYMGWRARLRRLRIPVDAPPGVASSTSAITDWLQNEVTPRCSSSTTIGEACPEVLYLAQPLPLSLH